MHPETVLTGEEVIIVIRKKDFVEPKIVKFEESLDKVTLNLNCYSTSSGGSASSSGPA